MDNVKKGDVYYKAFVNIESDLKEKSFLALDEWHVTTVNKKGVYLTEKNLTTYGKLSSKHGDFGFKAISANDRYYYQKLISDEFGFKLHGFYKSKSAALRSVLAEAKKFQKDAKRILTKLEKDIQKHTKSKKVKSK